MTSPVGIQTVDGKAITRLLPQQFYPNDDWSVLGGAIIYGRCELHTVGGGRLDALLVEFAGKRYAVAWEKGTRRFFTVAV